MPYPFKQLLSSQLGESTGIGRKEWVDEIVRCNYLLSDLVELLSSDTKTANRFLWLISELGLAHPEFLHQQLPDLFKAFEPFAIKHRQAFASYWLYVGVPESNEAHAIDFMMQILKDRQTSATIKIRGAKVLGHLAEKYPELKSEIKEVLLPLLEDGSATFTSSIGKIIAKL